MAEIIPRKREVYLLFFSAHLTLVWLQTGGKSWLFGLDVGRAEVHLFITTLLQHYYNIANTNLELASY